MALSADAVKRLMTATASADAGNEVATAMNTNSAFVAASAKVIAALVVATSVSQTVDFGALLVGDRVLMIPATAGNADLITITVAGDLGQAAVIGNAYLVLRAFTAPAASAVVF